MRSVVVRSPEVQGHALMSSACMNRQASPSVTSGGVCADETAQNERFRGRKRAVSCGAAAERATHTASVAVRPLLKQERSSYASRF